MAGGRLTTRTYGRSLGAGDTGGTGEPTTGEFRIHRPTRSGPNTRRCAVHSAARTCCAEKTRRKVDRAVFRKELPSEGCFYGVADRAPTKADCVAGCTDERCRARRRP